MTDTEEFPMGVWMNDNKYVGYRGSVVVLRFDKPTSSGMFYELSRCSECDLKRFEHQHGRGRVAAWLILPP